MADHSAQYQPDQYRHDGGFLSRSLLYLFFTRLFLMQRFLFTLLVISIGDLYWLSLFAALLAVLFILSHHFLSYLPSAPRPSTDVKIDDEALGTDCFMGNILKDPGTAKNLEAGSIQNRPRERGVMKIK